MPLMVGILFTTSCMMMPMCMMHGMNHDKSEAKEEKIAEENVDPVCGAIVDRETALSIQYGGRTYLFDTEECKKVFQAKPERFVGNANKAEAEQHQH